MRIDLRNIHRLLRTRNLLPTAWFLVAFWATAGADPMDSAVTTSLDRDTVYIGDPIIFSIDVDVPQDIVWQPPPPGEHLGPFEVRNYEVLTAEAEEDGHTRMRVLWTLVSFTTGDLEIPPVQIVMADSSGRSDTLSTRGQMITVASLNPDPQGDIHDIKPPLSLPGGRAWIWWLIGGALLAAGGLIVYRRLRRTKIGRAIEEIAYQGPPRPAHEIALEELARVGSLNLIQRGLIKRFYIEISEVIRRYIGRRYGIQTMERTTAELMVEMSQATLPREHIEAFQPFFRECDLVKFAKLIPGQEHLDGALEQARELVLLTKEEPPDGEPENDTAAGAEETMAAVSAPGE